MRRFLLLFLFVFNSSSFAYDCYFNAMTGPCWKKYEVTIFVYDNEKNNILTTIKIPKGKLWARSKIKCHTNQGLLYKATFKPKIWKDSKQDIYTAKALFSTQMTIKPKTTAWVIPICFPNDFSEVPLPPSATTTCGCNEVVKTIPPIPGEIK